MTIITTQKDEETEVEEEKEEQINSQKAIWLRPKSEITNDEYSEFYKHLSHDMNDPAETIHYNAEGAIEFKALLFIPEKRPFDLNDESRSQSAFKSLCAACVYLE